VTAPVRPLPRFPEPDTEPFWTATTDHRLLYQVDPATGAAVFFPRRITDAAVDWAESAGQGTIYTFTVIRQHGHPYFRARVPYVVAFVDLDEGVRILTEIRADLETVHIGARVSVEWEDHDELSVPVFRVVEA
jgi:uncharacterized OB-fold protein